MLLSTSEAGFRINRRHKKSLDGKIYDLDVALNMVSGTGKEHMAILSALLKLGLGIRLMAVTKNGVVEL